MRESINITISIWISIFGAFLHFIGAFLNIIGGVFIWCGLKVKLASESVIDKSFQIGGV